MLFKFPTHFWTLIVPIDSAEDRDFKGYRYGIF
jgi:hypothetical protein